MHLSNWLQIDELSTINNTACLVPIATNVLLARKTMHHGPFNMGQVCGMIVNIVNLCWLIFVIVFFSFPYYIPVTGGQPLPRKAPLTQVLMLL